MAVSDRELWEFDIPKQAKKTARGLVEALGGELA